MSSRAALLEWLGYPPRQLEARQTAALPHYTSCLLTQRQFMLAFAFGYVILFTASYLFYHSLAAAMVLALGGMITPRLYRASLIKRQRLSLTLQFKEALHSITSSLAAGRSVENAFAAALDDLQLLYPDPRTAILLELEIIRTRLSYGESLEQSLTDFGRRASVEEITQFVDVFVTCKRTGGDLVEVIRRTSQTIGEKLDVQQEIAVLLAQKRFEARIMMAVPFVFLAFLGLSAPDYMEPLYSSGIGYLVLTAALILLAGCYWLMHKVMNIRV
ncbi:type II secretion system F family protein [Paenibacillus sp. GCM10027626]|uniref:type II secretion system F family protein n=1 Tax=Paenibacillus sp. GCM10027626 TaxID=3273411 RepID=UPI0036383B37